MPFKLPDPLLYHQTVVSFLKDREPEAWKWALSSEAQTSESEALRTALLKSHYRLDPAAHPEIAERCGTMAQRLELNIPVTLYQSQAQPGMNAALWYLHDEAHLVFTGPILEKLQGAELDALLAHELAHARLWRLDGGAFMAADRLLSQAAVDPRVAASHVQTARRLRLYTEIFADRGALAGCGDLHATVAALVKTETGLARLSAEAYLKQAEELFARGEAKTEGVDHPETFIRARALRLWAEEDASLESWLQQVIEGPVAMDALDLSGQQHLVGLTRRFLSELLRPAWFQSPATLAHARAFFLDFTPSRLPDEGLAEELAKGAKGDSGTREYWQYLLLDFASVDPELEDVPLAAAIGWARRLEMLEAFEKLALRELNLSRKQFAKLKKEAPEILARAEAK